MATAQSEKTLELKVGAFVIVGLAVLAILVVQFGRVGEGFKTYYGLTVKFPDASGLLKGSDVLLAGAKIGRVSEGPRLDRAAAVAQLEREVGQARARLQAVLARACEDAVDLVAGPERRDGGRLCAQHTPDDGHSIGRRVATVDWCSHCAGNADRTG